MARTRLDRDDGGVRLWLDEPWDTWAKRDDRIAREAERHAVPEPRRPLAGEPDGTLLSIVGSAHGERQREALRELNRRGPQPGLLPLAERIPFDVTKELFDLDTPLTDALRALGAGALPVLRPWAATPGHPMCGAARGLLADHGDESDVPQILAAWARLDEDPGGRCGYDRLAAGLARIGGDRVRDFAVPRLQRLWTSPHSHERTAYLKALLALDPGAGAAMAFEGLFDCEPGVRLLAIEHASPADRRPALTMISEDPLEDDEVRAAARLRLQSETAGEN
ncbi:hypothetical protein GCM10009828_073640 [Actinoplanes couchii]|uniref:HEAT repeat domain-containing protein n=1 Tax=Actinoplanes couchii TaxID=403638 RepID=A0ABQ3X0E5_9ACTN|nr:hypothetical protein Aco03nite_003300 [Actinoplanes couchii]